MSAAQTKIAPPPIAKIAINEIKNGEIRSDEIKPEDLRNRSPLAQLLHALNQPLTGLQCSMEVAVASPRTVEQYVRGLRQGLELTERMRALVEAIREVADGLDEADAEREVRETVELEAALGGVVDELAPVAEAKSVSLVVVGSAAAPLLVCAARRALTGLLFRLLESALSLAAQGSLMKIETGGAEQGAAAGARSLRVRWQGEEAERAASRAEPDSRAELGLLVAQAACERAAGRWERERSGEWESVTVQLPGAAASPGNF